MYHKISELSDVVGHGNVRELPPIMKPKRHDVIQLAQHILQRRSGMMRNAM